MRLLRYLLALGLLGGVFLAGLYLGITRGVPFQDARDVWSIAIYRGPSPTRLSDPPGIDNPVLTAASVTDVTADFVADPFMVREGKTWYLFFEVLTRENDQGDIGLATSPDGERWSYRKIVLDEPFHLSYPHVFSHDGMWYMIPETHEDRAIRLYRATSFPEKWAFVTRLRRGHPYLDSSIVRFQDRWWLFTSTLGNNILLLYHARQLMGPWEHHPRNPLRFGDKNISRPGGRVVEHDGRLVRFAQDDDPTYGNQLHAFEITEISPTTYVERRATREPILGASGQGWNADGMHHVDPHRLADGSWIAVVDGHRKTRIYGWQY